MYWRTWAFNFSIVTFATQAASFSFLASFTTTNTITGIGIGTNIPHQTGTALMSTEKDRVVTTSGHHSDPRLIVRRIKKCTTVLEAWEMIADSPSPHELVGAELLNICARHNDADTALKVVSQLVPASDTCRARAISILGSCGRHKDVLNVLTREPKITSAGPYNSAIAACGRSKQWKAAIDVLEDMPKHLVSTVTVNAALTVLYRAKQPRECASLLKKVRKRWPEAPPDRTSYHTTISCWLETGHIREGCHWIRTMEQEAINEKNGSKLFPNTDTYNRLSAALTRWPAQWSAVQEVLPDKIGKEIAPMIDFQHWKLKKHEQGKKSFWELGTLLSSSNDETEGSDEVVIGIQPNRNPAVNGMKLAFYHRNTSTKHIEKLGYLLMINSYKNCTSQFLGQYVDETYRGQGLAKIWLAVWFRLCIDSGIQPCTGKIRKPLLCLVLQHTFGMVPKADGLEVSLSPGEKHDEVVLWSPTGQSLEGAFSPLDLRQQKISLSVHPPTHPGRKVFINCDFEAPETSRLEAVIAPILEDRFKLHKIAQKEDLKQILLGA
jgi:pentatricopeptide repeat protein